MPSLGGYVRKSFVGTPYRGGLAGFRIRGEVLESGAFRLLRADAARLAGSRAEPRETK